MTFWDQGDSKGTPRDPYGYIKTKITFTVRGGFFTILGNPGPLWGLVNFKIKNSRSFFIIFQAKNVNFKTQDFSPHIE